jgi:hypothetical protein
MLELFALAEYCARSRPNGLIHIGVNAAAKAIRCGVSIRRT